MLGPRTGARIETASAGADAQQRGRVHLIRAGSIGIPQGDEGQVDLVVVVGGSETAVAQRPSSPLHVENVVSSGELLLRGRMMPRSMQTKSTMKFPIGY